MSIPQLSTDLNIIQALEDEPNDVTGLTPAQVKAKFDEAVNIIKDYINNTLLLQLESTLTNSSGADNIGSALIAGIAGDTVHSQIANLLTIAQAAQAGTILPFTITFNKLSQSIQNNMRWGDL